MTEKASVFAIFLFSPKINVSEKSTAEKNTRRRLRRAFKIIFEFYEVPARRIIRRFMEQCWGLFVKSKMNFHKFSFKNEAVWILVFLLFPLIVGIIITLLLFAFRRFDL